MLSVKLGMAALLVAVFCVVDGFAWQAEPKAAQERVVTVKATQTSMDRPLVEFFASKLVLCNNGAIHCAQSAVSKATNADVKQFAEMIAKDHAKFNEQLAPFNASYGVTPMTSATATSQKPTAKVEVKTEKEQVAGKDTPAKDNPAVAQPPAIVKTQTETSLRTGDSATLQRVFEVCHAASDAGMVSFKEMLAKKSGDEFDKAFVGSQAMAHGMILAELKTLESRSTDEFQSVVRNIRTTVEGHMAKAESLCKALEVAKK